MYNGKPVIGLTCSFRPHDWTPQHYLNESYVHTVRHFGGIPLLIPVLAENDELEYLISTIDGLILTGGDDIDPALFGESILNDTVQLCPERDRAEYAVLDLAVKRDVPILGICRGVQVMNVYFGGTLYQDIPAQLPHCPGHSMEKPDHRTCHDCRVTPGSPLAKWTGCEIIQVNSHHHQSVKAVAPGCEIMGCCSDGIVEAIWKPDAAFVCAVQWHPEKIWDIEESSAKIFEAFIEACK